MKSSTLPALAACVLGAGSAFAQQADVTFFVIGKHANVEQDANGKHRPVDHSFFAEIFLQPGGDVDSATLTFPNGESTAFEDMRLASGGARDNLLLVSGDARFDTFDALQQRYPDGQYTVSFAAPSGNVDTGALTFKRRPLPKPPVVSVSQRDAADCAVLQPGVDMTVNWSEFAGGRQDPNDVLDDLVFVILTDEAGRRVAHSGRPFSGDEFLTFADRQFTVDGGVLLPNSTYTLSVEHALLDDTTRFAGVPAFTTRAVTTKRRLETGPDGRGSCKPARSIPPLEAQVTMFYYEDISEAAHFYGTILGLETTIDWDWVKFFKTGPSSNVGLVQQGDGAFHDAGKNNAVMLSLVTTDVDAWYARLGGRDDVTVLKEIGSGGGIRSFLLEDPGGYTVEFFQWLNNEP